tara:strand:- start:7936 stop:13458 length:5523 start_codon:yes stop_codon:yes gene_type:complete
MTTTKQATDRHKPTGNDDSETTLRLDPTLKPLLEWAASTGLLTEFQVIVTALRLQFPEQPKRIPVWGSSAIKFFRRFLQTQLPTLHSTTLAEWSDNPVCQDILRFLSGLTQLSSLDAVSALKDKPVDVILRGRLTDQYLLALIISDQGHCDDSDLKLWRQRLRLWVVVQAISLVEKHNESLDGNIQTIARFLTIEYSSIHQLPDKQHSAERWALINRLFYRIQSELEWHSPPDFKRFNAALRTAAMQLAADESDKASKSFLLAIVGASLGERKPIRSGKVAVAPFPFSIDVPEPRPINPFHDKLFWIPPANAPVGDGLAEEEEGLVAVDVSNHISMSKQRLATRSVLIQSAEQSHYLPWDWERLLPNELPTFQGWLESTHASGQLAERVGGFLAWIAIHTARSMVQTARILISQTPSDEWRLCPHKLSLIRNAPYRVNSWQPSPEQREFLASYANEVHLHIPETYHSSLKALLGTFPKNESCIAEHWELLSKMPLEKWFEEQMTGPLARIKQRMTAQVLPQHIYEQTGNTNQSRLYSIHPNSAVPGACAYTTIDLGTLRAATNVSFCAPGNPHDGIVVFGSKLDPLERHLHASVAALREKVESLRSESPVAFHNAFVTYTVLAIHAATGARPIRDPYERLSHFNWENGFVYVDDKHDRQSHQGRLCPLPASLSEHLQTQYLAHLRYLATAFEAIGSPLADQINALLAPQTEQTLPFFFYLNEQFQWRSVAGESMDALELWKSHLPHNLFRHRLIKRLSEQRVDPEVIDGLAGHSERGVASYGDYSIRCWSTDMDSIRRDIEATYNSLEFNSISSWYSQPTLEPHQSHAAQKPQPYGSHARVIQRRLSDRSARRSAKDDIKILLKKHLGADKETANVSDISDEALDALINAMVFTDKHTPHPKASVRYSYLLRWIESQEFKRQSLLKVKTRYLHHTPETSPFWESIPNTLPTWHALQDAANQLAKSWNGNFSPTYLSKKDSLVVGAALLVIENRLCYRQLLSDLMRNCHARLLYVEGESYLEYEEKLDINNLTTPVQRHHVSLTAAALLARGLSSKYSFKESSSSVPELLIPLVDLLHSKSNLKDNKTTTFFSALCHVVDGANRVELPGMLSATLSGRVLSTCFNLCDWIRVRSGQKVNVKQNAESSTDPQDEIEKLINSQVSKFRASPLADSDEASLESNARQFSAAIRKILSGYSPGRSDGCTRAIRDICGQWQTRVSATMLLLGEWIAHRIEEGCLNSSASLARNTVEQYFSELDGPFCGLAYDQDLLAFEPEEVTTFYAGIIDSKDRSPKSLKYLCDRLVNFHEWAATRGVAHPHWSELDLPEASRSVSPGIILEHEYLKALHFILKGLDIEDDEFQLQLAFVLLCCYRFGLRVSEAAGMQLRDWHDHTGDGSIVVYVRVNAFRGLKSDNSRRAVPLLFELSQIELQIINRIKGQALTDSHLRETTHLVSNGIDGRPSPLIPLVSATLINILRAVTGNDTTVLHHCRHSFHCFCAAVLFDIRTPFTEMLVPKTVDWAVLRRRVLGQYSLPSRRSSMALARLMGHAHPRTGMVHYNHLMAEWADSLAQLSEGGQYSIHKKCLHPMDLPIKGDLDERLLLAMGPSLETPTMELALRALKLMAHGKRKEQVAEMLWLPDEFMEKLSQCVEKVGTRMKYNKTKYKPANKWAHSKTDYLCQIKPPSWKALFRHERNRKHSEPAESPVRLEELPHMIGENRQILLKTESSFKLLRAVLDYFEIEEESIKLYQRRSKAEIAAYAKQYGFEPIKALHEKSRKQAEDPSIDMPVFCFDPLNPSGDSDDPSYSYCALQIKKNSVLPLRSSFDITAVLIAYVAVVGFA